MNSLYFFEMWHKIFFFALLTTILCGCYPDNLKYKLGVGTRSIAWTVLEADKDILKSDSFIVIVEYYSRFIQFENEFPIYVPKARLAFPDKKGDYQINFDLKASTIDLTFIASGYKMHSFSFRRQLGVGDLQYNVRLKKSNFWQNDFFINTRPFLENFIIEQRYEMPDSQQLFIGNWLDEIKKYFAKKNK